MSVDYRCNWLRHNVVDITAFFLFEFLIPSNSRSLEVHRNALNKHGTKRSGAAQSPPVDGINRMCDSPSPRLMLDLEVKSLFLLTKQNKRNANQTHNSSYQHKQSPI